jgi:hypothetical protein
MRYPVGISKIQKPASTQVSSSYYICIAKNCIAKKWCPMGRPSPVVSVRNHRPEAIPTGYPDESLVCHACHNRA